MTPLIDSDILLYEIGFSSETKDDGVVTPRSWDFAQGLLDERIKLICEEVEATEPPLLFLTNTKRINKLLNKQREREDAPPKEYVENFRVEAAKEKEYKGGRKTDKPFHFYNLLSYILGSYSTHINENGLEADDALCVYQIDTMKSYGVSIDVGGKTCLVDYEDWLWAKKIKWTLSDGYVVSDTGRGEARQVIALHRAILGNPEEMVVDHINGDILDNRRYNLRVCTAKQNRYNSKPQKTSLSGMKGVSWNKGKGKWEAAIRVEGKLKFLGNFFEVEEAGAAYDAAAKQHFGEYARLNLEPPFIKPFKQTIICSRDKDVRQCPGLHYSWEVGKQAAIGPIEVDELGWLEKKSSQKVFGVGDKFFYYQMIAGDGVDNIGGIKGKGPMFAYHLINEATSSRECYELVAEKYVQAWGDDWKEKMKEQARLLWMIRELNEDGSRVEWKPPRKDG